MIDFLKNIDSGWTLFLDRDGVINKRIYDGYVSSIKEFHFLPGVLESLSFFAVIFDKIIVVTNQQGIGKGIMSENQLLDIHSYMENMVKQNHGRIDAVYWCPDLVFKPDNCRKPGVKMAEMAKDDFPEIDFSKSIMVGDSKTDMEFADNLGMFKIFVSKENDNVDADLRVSGLLELKKILLKYL